MRQGLAEQIAEAKRSWAETLIGSPHIDHLWGTIGGLEREIEEKQKRLAACKAAWNKMIAPALDDPDWRRIAEKKGLIK